jgi:hypothetical protein
MNKTDLAGTLTGRYVRRGDVLEYYYFASWTRTGDSVMWDADIHRDGQAVSEVEGVVEGVKVSEENRDIRLAVETAIETGGDLQAEK